MARGKKTLEQLDKQIEALQREREAIRHREIAGVIERIKDAIAHYDLTADDLGFGGARKPRAQAPAAKRRGRPAKAARKPAGVVRFRDQAGNTWSGRGKRPNWLKAALAEGKTLQDLAV
ncbi:H-NS histone family protein [Aquabacterium sp. J223]|uniref:H-NS histone family protein n=1 Tax=Aquabacterium sp. J223 TaxID=2898431 RepID=UPI0021AE01E4|nr:H-NS histone family protein [Aquabacterium sp. J223]UUX94325.1 H-NS histone family protein [Aquabacterium sp. J223]